MKRTGSMVISMRLPLKSGKRLKRMAATHGWTPSDASARLVEEGLRRVDFAFIDFRDSKAGRQAYVQGSSLAVWEIMLLARSHGNAAAAVAKHLRWPEAKVQAAFNYAKAYPDEIAAALADNDLTDFDALSRMLPQAKEFVVGTPARE
ncbi:MAG: transcriptional regulator [Opitutaceae bacterium]